jgi:hypothetical protein
MPFAIIFVCAALLAGCGDDGSAPLSRGQACDQLVSSLCARLVECDPNLGPTDEQDCNSAFGPMCCADAACDETSIDTGRARDCDSALAAFACSGLASQQLPSECRGTPVDDVY